MDTSEQDTLRMVQIISWVSLAVMVGVGWFFFERLIVRSVLVGGFIANISFWLMKRDLTRLLKGELAAVKARFFIKYYARMAVITVMLFLVIKFGAVDVIALLAGLSTVFISIAVVAIYGVRKELNT